MGVCVKNQVDFEITWGLLQNPENRSIRSHEGTKDTIIVGDPGICHSHWTGNVSNLLGLYYYFYPTDNTLRLSEKIICPNI